MKIVTVIVDYDNSLYIVMDLLDWYYRIGTDVLMVHNLVSQIIPVT